MDVTLSSKRYIMACCCCDLMFEATRADQLTCSGACRVKAHRNGSLKTLRDLAESNDLKPGMLLQAMAAERLGFGDLVKNNRMKLDGDIRVGQAFDKRVMQFVERQN